MSLIKGKYVSRQVRETLYAAFPTNASFPNELLIASAGRGNLLIFVNILCIKEVSYRNTGYHFIIGGSVSIFSLLITGDVYYHHYYMSVYVHIKVF